MKLTLGLASLGVLLAGLLVVGMAWLVQALPETRPELTRRSKSPPDFTPAFATIPWKRDVAAPQMATVTYAQTPWNRLAKLPGEWPLALLEDPIKGRKTLTSPQVVVPVAGLPWVRNAAHPARANVLPAQLPWKKNER